MPELWIVDRDADRRAALADMIEAHDAALSGAPGDARFERAPSPRVVLLGADPELEPALAFHHRFFDRMRAARWVVIVDPGHVEQARALFDDGRPEIATIPRDLARLREIVHAPASPRALDPVSWRRRREALAAWLAWAHGDERVPGLAEALHPPFAREPVRVCGEPGTGRGRIARWIATAPAAPRAQLVEIDGADARHDEASLLAELAPRTPHDPARGIVVVVDDADRLAPALQRRLAAWIAIGLPRWPAGAPWLRWIVTTGETGPGETLDPALADALDGLALRLPPLRERPRDVDRLVDELARAFAQRTGEPRRRFSREAIERLRRWPWPANLRELEAVVRRTLLARPVEPIAAGDLALGGRAIARSRGAGAARREDGPVRIEPEETWSRPASPAGAPASEGAEPASPSAPTSDRDALSTSSHDASTSRPEPPAAPPRARSLSAERSSADTVLRRLAASLARRLAAEIGPMRAAAEAVGRNGGAAGRAGERFVDLARERVGALDELARRLAAFVDAPPTPPRRVDLGALAARVMSAFDGEIRRRKLALELHAPAGIALVRADEALLATALGCLIELVLRETHDGSPLHVAVTPAPDGTLARLVVRWPVSREPGDELARALSPSPEAILVEWAAARLAGHFDTAPDDGGSAVAVLELPSAEAT